MPYTGIIIIMPFREICVSLSFTLSLTLPPPSKSLSLSLALFVSLFHSFGRSLPPPPSVSSGPAHSHLLSFFSFLHLSFSRATSFFRLIRALRHACNCIAMEANAKCVQFFFHQMSGKATAFDFFVVRFSFPLYFVFTPHITWSNYTHLSLYPFRYYARARPSQ